MSVLESKNKSIMKTYMIYFIVVVLFVLVRICASEGWLVFTEDTFLNSIFVNLIVQVGILFLIPLALYCLFLKEKPIKVFKTCNFDKPNYKILLLALLFGLLAYIFNVIISSVGLGIISFLGYHQHTIPTTVSYEMKDFIADIFLTALLPAFCEEFTHRGILLQCTKHAGFKQAIYISAVCFGLAHLNIEQVFYAMALGVFLGVMAVATKSIWPTIIVHFVNNLISVYLTGAKAFNWWGGNYEEYILSLQEKLGIIGFVVACVVLFILIVIVLCLIIYIMYKVARVSKAEKALSQTYSKNIKLTGKNNDFKANTEVKKLVETSTNLNFDYDNMKDVLDFVLPKQKLVYKKTFKDNMFLIATLFLGILINIFTFIWGVI